MSYIISSGNRKPQWIPEPKAKKTSQADPAIVDAPVDAPVEEEANPFFDAVKELPGIKEQVTSLGLGEALEKAKEAIDTAKEVAVKEGVIEPGAVSAPVSDVAPVAPPAPADVAPVAPATPAPEVPAPAAEAPKLEEKKESAPPFEKKDDVKVEEKKEESPAKEVDEVEIEIPGVAEKKEDGVEKESCGMNVGASVDDGKLKSIAKLSPENRKDLGKFWKDDLGMPAEWVDAMLKDY